MASTLQAAEVTQKGGGRGGRSPPIHLAVLQDLCEKGKRGGEREEDEERGISLSKFIYGGLNERLNP